MARAARSWRIAALAGACAVLPPAARADLQDEIQVYDDAINRPGERGLELHVNTTPRGRAVPDYPGEIVPRHALRITPEFSLGLTRELEAGLYLPSVLRPDGRYEAAGAKVRLKWLPLQAGTGGGAFGGVNVELSRVARRYSQSRVSMETRFIAGWRDRDWLFAVNPSLEFGLSDGFGGRRPDFTTGVKAARRVGDGLAAGVEYYRTSGPLARSLPWRQQDNRIYLALDVDREPWSFNVGLGYGLTPGSDRWTLKAIVDIPLPQAR